MDIQDDKPVSASKASASGLNKLLSVFLFFEFLTVVYVMGVFKLIADRQIAALFAGSGFILLGVGISWFSFKSKARFQLVSFWAALIFLGSIAVPMMIVRLWSWGTPFELVSIFGIPGPKFHGLSNTIYMLLVAATVLDRLRLRLNRI